MKNSEQPCFLEYIMTFIGDNPTLDLSKPVFKNNYYRKYESSLNLADIIALNFYEKLSGVVFPEKDRIFLSVKNLTLNDTIEDRVTQAFRNLDLSQVPNLQSLFIDWNFKIDKLILGYKPQLLRLIIRGRVNSGELDLSQAPNLQDLSLGKQQYILNKPVLGLVDCKNLDLSQAKNLKNLNLEMMLRLEI